MKFGFTVATLKRRADNFALPKEKKKLQENNQRAHEQGGCEVVREESAGCALACDAQAAVHSAAPERLAADVGRADAGRGGWG
jgi:hypothetical protein